jgi:hypothetical protein
VRARGVDLQPADAEEPADAVRRRPSQQRADTGAQLGVAHGLGDDVVGAVAERAQHGDLVGARAEHDRRQPGVERPAAGADLGEQGERAARLGRVAEQQQVGDRLGDRLAGPLDGADRRRRVVVGGELVAQEPRRGRVGLDDEDR